MARTLAHEASGKLQQPLRRNNSGVKALLVAGLLLASVVATALPAAAASSCVRTADMLDIELQGSNALFETFTLERDGAGNINLTRSALLSNTPIDCGDATTVNVNTIDIGGTAAIENLQVDLVFGGFTPGQTLEATPEDSEIEIKVNLGAGSDTATVLGTTGPDRLVMGARGMNVNDDGDGDDLRFGATVEVPGMSGDDGVDRLLATGGSGTGGPTISPIALIGGEGQDVLRGGSASDFITGEEDDDLLTGGSGNDRLGADVGPGAFFAISEEGDDVIRGGPGGDVLRGGQDEDRLDGGPGDDDEHGSDDDDIFLQGRRPNGGDHLFGGGGQDEVRYQARRARVQVTLDNKRNDGAKGEEDSVGFKSDVEDVIGGRGPDAIKGDKDANVLEGRAGADLLVGRGGIDTCVGGPGADVLKSCE